MPNQSPTTDQARTFRLARFACWLILISVTSMVRTASSAEPDPRPNVVWILSEDNSKHYLKHFDVGGVATPAIESMAQNGVTFDRAFSNAPVCSVARSTLITGCYAPRLGMQYHRKNQTVPLPETLRMFPAYLRQSGYYTTNDSKTDYNIDQGNLPEQKPWDESSKKASWKNRPTADTPFFHVETHADSHESSLHFDESKTSDPTEFSQDDVRVPAYLPDTPLQRFTAAYYRDRIKAIDNRVSKTITDLKDAGSLENTFVFYFGDHGGVLPRSKGYLFESGLHVPLVVRIPANFQGMIDRTRGSRTNAFVSFIDFAPTVLNLAGVTVPDQMDGRAFLGGGVDADQVDQRNTTFGNADRMDEKYDLVRSVRIGDWKYIRYFEAQYPNSLSNQYRMKMLAYQQWRAMHDAGELTPEQSAFFQPRPVEALFDLERDPDETNNLAGTADWNARLTDMRRTLTMHLKQTNDLSFVTESNLIDRDEPSPVKFGREQSAAIAKYVDTVNIALLPIDQAITELLTSLNSGDPLVRYWALTAGSSMTAADRKAKTAIADDEAIIQVVRRRTLDASPLVAARAAELLMILIDDDPRDVLYRCLAQATNEAEVLQILNIAAFIHDAPGRHYPINQARIRMGFQVKPQSDIQTRLEHFLDADSFQ